MDIKQITKDIINIPNKYYKLGNKSFVTLLNDSTYFDNTEYINETNIEEALHEYPGIIEEWLLYSDDKRTSGWGFGYNAVAEKYHVANGMQQSIFSDKFQACAYFIMREIEGVKLRHVKQQNLKKTLDVRHIIRQVMDIPYHLLQIKNDSFKTLLKSTNYFSTEGCIDEKDIIDVLNNNSKIVEEWLKFSANKRSGWFFYKDNTIDRYIISYLPQTDNIKDHLFVDKFTACASYIRLEVENMRVRDIMHL